MSVYSVPVTIGVDEDAIAKKITEDVETKVVNAIVVKVENVIYEKSYYGKTSNEPLRNMIRKVIEEVIAEKTDDIVKIAAEILADKLSRTKAVKEKAAEVAKEVFK